MYNIVVFCGHHFEEEKNMKKFLAVMLTLSLLLTGVVALAD